MTEIFLIAIAVALVIFGLRQLMSTRQQTSQDRLRDVTLDYEDKAKASVHNAPDVTTEFTSVKDSRRRGMKQNKPAPKNHIPPPKPPGRG